MELSRTRLQLPLLFYRELGYLDLERGREIHMEFINSGFQLDFFVNSALVDMYGKCGHLEMAIKILRKCLKSLLLFGSP